MIYKGIDVSLYQGDIDWKRVKADGIAFAMIKASQGRTAGYDSPFTDPGFHKNRQGAGQAGLYWGCYHYLTCRNEDEARAEAEYFAALVRPYFPAMKLWAAVDVEDHATVGTMSPEEITRCVEIFCDTVRAAGLRPMVYANSYWLNTKFTAPARVPIWEANLSIGERPGRAKVWQYSFTGKVDGIEGDVDLNLGVDIIGDANGDGRVTAADAAAVLKYVAKWRGVQIDEGQADVNDDGHVTLSDVAAILKIIAG